MFLTQLLIAAITDLLVT